MNGEAQTFQFVDEFRREAIFEFCDRPRVDLFESHATRFIKRRAADLFKQLLDHAPRYASPSRVVR